MPIAQLYSGSSTISTTEFSLVNGSTSLASVATSAVVQVFIDLTAMTYSDKYLIKVKDKTRSGDTQRTIFSAEVVGGQPDPIWVTPTLILMHGWDVTVTNTYGVDRTIVWSIRAVS